MSDELDPTFHRSLAEAIAAVPEQLPYVAASDPIGEKHDAMAVIDRKDTEPSPARVFVD